jgi:hypothetical protein
MYLYQAKHNTSFEDLEWTSKDMEGDEKIISLIQEGYSVMAISLFSQTIKMFFVEEEYSKFYLNATEYKLPVDILDTVFTNAKRIYPAKNSLRAKVSRFAHDLLKLEI